MERVNQTESQTLALRIPRALFISNFQSAKLTHSQTQQMEASLPGCAMAVLESTT